MTVAITINITAANKSITLFLGSSPYHKYSAYNKDLEINLAFLYKYQYIGIKVNSNMKERLLIKCDTTIYADEITNLLIENNIVSRQHDADTSRPAPTGIRSARSVPLWPEAHVTGMRPTVVPQYAGQRATSQWRATLLQPEVTADLQQHTR